MANDDYLSLAQFRAFEPASALPDDVLLILLGAAMTDILAFAGPLGTRTERLQGSGNLLLLSCPAASVTTVVEDDVTLNADDYELSATGNTVRRLDNGHNPRYDWGYEVIITYRRVDDTPARQRAQLELTRLAISTNPNLASQRIGEWTETYTAGGAAEQRADILAPLANGMLLR